MTPTDTTEKGLETLIVRYMTGSDGLAVADVAEHDFGAGKVSEASLNGFPSGDIVAKIQSDPYRRKIKSGSSRASRSTTRLALVWAAMRCSHWRWGVDWGLQLG